MKRSVLTKSWPLESYLWCIRGIFYWKESYPNLLRKAKTLCLSFFLISDFYSSGCCMISWLLQSLKNCITSQSIGGRPKKFIQENPDELFGQPNITQLIINRRWEESSHWIPQKEVSLDILHSKQVELLNVVKMLIKRYLGKVFMGELQVTVAQLTEQISEKDG